MRKDLVKYQDDDYNVEIEVGQASVAMGIRRSEVWFDSRSGELAEMQLLARVAILQTYPACIAGTLSVKNLPKRDTEGELLLDENGEEIPYPEQLDIDKLTLEIYLALPEALGSIWKDAIFNLNPHWLPALPKEEVAGEVGEPNSETS